MERTVLAAAFATDAAVFAALTTLVTVAAASPRFGTAVGSPFAAKSVGVKGANIPAAILVACWRISVILGKGYQQTKEELTRVVNDLGITNIFTRDRIAQPMIKSRQ
jgi:hypothetical protein